MNDTTLEGLLATIESDRAERKESAGDMEKIRQAVCAFANDMANHAQPGVVFVGAKDNGQPSHLQITDLLLRNLASMRDDGNILPIPSLIVERRILCGSPMAIVIVQPSDSPPVRYKGQTWIRVGPRRAIASSQEERQLGEKRRYKDMPFDIRPLNDVELAALDQATFRSVYLVNAIDAEILRQNHRSLEHQLVSLRFAHPGPPISPTNLGILVCAGDPTQYLPGAYIQFCRFDGSEITDPIKSQKELRGPIYTLMNLLDELLKINISTQADITSASIEKREADYPIVALQQLVRNSVMHRTYEGTNSPIRIYWFNDRVEIHNPGGPYGMVNKRNFGTPGATDYRNPHLAEAMKTLGYVQRFGVGIELARKQLHMNGNPPPNFQVEDGFIAVVVLRRA